jgi:uncharacterized membrane protein (UPF0127 family)
MSLFRQWPAQLITVQCSGIHLQIYRADRFLSRAIGLLGSRSLESHEGLWLQHCNSIHTFGMRYEIDALGLDKKSRITDMRSRIRPMRCARLRGASAVIELRAGACQELGLSIGDTIDWGRP